MTSTKTALAVASAIQRFNPREMTGVGPSTFATLLDAALLPRRQAVDKNADAVLFGAIHEGDDDAPEAFTQLLDDLSDIYMDDRRILALYSRWNEFVHQSKLADTCGHCGKDIRTADEFTREMGFCSPTCCGAYDDAHPVAY